MSRRLDIEEIARRSGVSRSTVSRVLNDQPGVRSKTRARVLEVIRDSDYQPNQAARSLTTRRTETIALVIPMPLKDFLGDMYLTTLMRSTHSAATHRNYLMTLWLGETEVDEQWLYQRMVRRNAIDGLLIASAPDGDWLINQLLKDNFPFVMMGRPNVNGVNYVDVDNRMASRQAVEHLIGLGYRRIGTITGPANHVAGRDRMAGYTDALQGAGRPVDYDLIVNGYFTDQGSYDAMRSLLNCGVDAIFAASDQMALSAMRALRDAGLSVPGDVAVVGFDDIPQAETNGLTTVQQSPETAGEIITNLLIDLCVQKPPLTPRGILLPTQLVVRQTCGASRQLTNGINTPRRT